ncbi:hypothetical protein [Kitasatospora sp. GP82]|uniref:hypothetical protein n=1 Tax=Kitasatospora sp. GP82 TaxID=3035089 RepID=UPI00247654B8|nr:hypothetical protein [Kitasatospora sp. GP82]MDH6127390.1 hypothetical protein [Kitasatospora sp. GP82]
MLSAEGSGSLLVGLPLVLDLLLDLLCQLAVPLCGRLLGSDLGIGRGNHGTVRDNVSTAAPGGVRTIDQFTVNNSSITNNIPSNCTGSPVIIAGCIN